MFSPCFLREVFDSFLCDFFLSDRKPRLQDPTRWWETDHIWHASRYGGSKERLTKKQNGWMMNHGNQDL